MATNKNATANTEEMGVTALVNDIKTHLTQKSASTRDEVRVMKAMLNDRNFQYSEYSNSGVTQHCPATEFRGMMANIVSSTTHMPKAEAETLVNSYEAKKSDAETMVKLSKDFLNTALRTGRSVNLGGTEKSNISIQLKDVEMTTKRYPKKVGVNPDGSTRYENAESTVPAHEGLKVKSPCPDWVSDKKKE